MTQWISQQNPKIYMHAYPKSEPYFLESLEIKKMETQNSTFQWKYYKFFMQHFADDIGDAQYRGENGREMQSDFDDDLQFKGYVKILWGKQEKILHF